MKAWILADSTGLLLIVSAISNVAVWRELEKEQVSLQTAMLRCHVHGVTSTLHLSCRSFFFFCQTHYVVCPLKHSKLNVNVFAATTASNCAIIKLWCFHAGFSLLFSLGITVLAWKDTSLMENIWKEICVAAFQAFRNTSIDIFLGAL